QLLGADDVPALSKVMSAYEVQTLSAYRGTSGPDPLPVDWPLWNDDASRDERFIGYLNFLLAFCQPIHPAERELMSRFAKLGIGSGQPFDVDTMSDEVLEAIRAGVVAARERIAAKVHSTGQKVNGWISSDVFGTRAFYDGDYLLRAAAAMAGFGGNDVIEATYPTSREDSSGDPLDGANRYQITLATLPPTKAFWSVTMYDTSYDGTAGYLVENPINRYLINSTTQGLVYGEDGSLTITIQHAQPQDATERANWLPAPEGLFYLVMRIYWPEKAALDGSWNPPPVLRNE
ncbi:MAG: hypothetical protein AMJ56_18775, partial [Anaerolineae bacterium SG8_19]